jgi:hypothetical protein
LCIQPQKNRDKTTGRRTGKVKKPKPLQKSSINKKITPQMEFLCPKITFSQFYVQ